MPRGFRCLSRRMSGTAPAGLALSRNDPSHGEARWNATAIASTKARPKPAPAKPVTMFATSLPPARSALPCYLPPCTFIFSPETPVTAEAPEQAKPAGTAHDTAHGTALEPVRPPLPRFQPVLVATVVGAIILAIAIGSFWTSF